MIDFFSFYFSIRCVWYLIHFIIMIYLFLFDLLSHSRCMEFHLLHKIVLVFYSSIIVFYNSLLTVRSEEVFSTEQRQSIFAPNIHLLSQQQPLLLLLLFL